MSLEELFCRRRLRPLLQVYTQQKSAHREAEQEINGTGTGSCTTNIVVPSQRTMLSIWSHMQARNTHALLAMPNALTHVTLYFFHIGGSLSCLVLSTVWAESLVSTMYTESAARGDYKLVQLQ
jgi:hypothetical protein